MNNHDTHTGVRTDAHTHLHEHAHAHIHTQVFFSWEVVAVSRKLFDIIPAKAHITGTTITGCDQVQSILGDSFFSFH